MENSSPFFTFHHQFGGENIRFISSLVNSTSQWRSLSPNRRRTNIQGGDVCTNITLLEKTLILCKERFQVGTAFIYVAQKHPREVSVLGFWDFGVDT